MEQTAFTQYGDLYQAVQDILSHFFIANVLLQNTIKSYLTPHLIWEPLLMKFQCY